MMIKQSKGVWAKSCTEKAETFVKHLRNVFTPFLSTRQNDITESEIEESLSTPFEMPYIFVPISSTRITDVKKVKRGIKIAGLRAYHGESFTTSRQSNKAFKHYLTIFNSIIKMSYFSDM